MESLYGSQTILREVQGSVLPGKKKKMLPISIRYRIRTCAIVKIANGVFVWRSTNYWGKFLVISF